MIIENLVTKVFQLLLLLSPICVGADVDMDMFDLIFFRTGIIVLFMASLLDKPKRSMPEYINKIVFGLLGLCIFNIFVHSFAPAVMACTMNLFLGIAGIYIIYTYLDEKANLLKYIFIAGVINLLFFAGQVLGFDPVFDKIPLNSAPLAGSFLGNSARLGVYFALIAPFISAWLIPVAIFIGLLCSQYTIFIPVALLLLMKARSRRLKIALVFLVLLSVFILRTHILTSIQVRIDAISLALKYFFDRPLIGFGLGNIVDQKLNFFSTSYIRFLIGAGIFGLVWMGYAFKSIYKSIGNNRESLAFITLLLIASIEYPFELTRLWYLIIAIIIMFLIKKGE